MQTTQDNVDPAELAKFSELAHRWWDPESEFRPLHQINPLRLDWIKSLAIRCMLIIFFLNLAKEAHLSVNLRHLKPLYTF